MKKLNRKNHAAKGSAPHRKNSGGKKNAKASPPALLQAKLNALSKVLAESLTSVFTHGKAADRVLAAIFRGNRKYGSNDRRTIANALFALLRNYGVIEHLIPKLAELRNGGDCALSPAQMNRAALYAYVLDGTELPEALCFFAAEHGVKLPDSSLDFAAKADFFFSTCGAGKKEITTLALPSWVATHLPEDFPLATFCTYLQRRPPLWLRTQGIAPEELFDKLAQYGFRMSRHGRIGDAIRIDEARTNLYELTEFRAGLFEVQDLASQLIGLIAAPQPKSRWLDCCAGAGGKSLHLAELMKRSGTVVASDIRAWKLDDLRKRARRARFPNIQTKEWNGKVLAMNQRGKFDGILVDAPCSCSGVWRRNPDGKWTLKSQEVEELHAIQLRILNNVAAGVKNGGILCYATCSIFPRENMEVVQKFLTDHAEFTLEEFENPLTGGKAPGYLQILPSDGDCDALFIARMRKNGGAV